MHLHASTMVGKKLKKTSSQGSVSGSWSTPTLARRVKCATTHACGTPRVVSPLRGGGGGDDDE
jgi:hypothetical protein